MLENRWLCTERYSVLRRAHILETDDKGRRKNMAVTIFTD